MAEKSLDQKLSRIHADPRGAKDFILADAKDADMALAIGAPGRSPEAHSGELRYRTLSEFRDTIAPFARVWPASTIIEPIANARNATAFGQCGLTAGGLAKGV